jgi:prolipoprotein diacylglyceryl transferase
LLRLAIPTPTRSVIEIGPFTIHFYALCIIAGVALALWISHRRFSAVFPETGSVVSDVAVFAVPAGVIGGRLYHVVTTPEKYFGIQGSFVDIFKIWQGGLGIWGAIALGGLGAFMSYQRIRKHQVLPSFKYFADAVAPGLLLAQAVGRIGNWFNGELFGRPLNTWWGLSIPENLRPLGYLEFTTFHPTFAYEALWCVALAIILISLRNRFAPGSVFALYVLGYCVGRFFIEGLRLDFAHEFGGLRLNQYVALLLGCGALITFTRFQRSRG